MVLLKLDVEYEDIRGGTKSTFHYGSIKIRILWNDWFLRLLIYIPLWFY